VTAQARPAPASEAPFAQADYRPLLRRLEKMVEAAAKRPLGPIDREVLAMRLSGAICGYHGAQFLADQASRFTLHEIAAPLATVIETLEHEENIDEVLIALGAPVSLALRHESRGLSP
jgi:hypothetical protein